MFSSDSNLWGSPQWFVDVLDGEFHFTIDIAALPSTAKFAKFITPEMDAFKTPWGEPGDVAYGNPPYGDPEHPCKPHCTKKKCMGVGHKPECKPDCSDKKCVGRGFHIDTYVPGIGDWMKLAYEWSLQGLTVVYLVHARTDTRWWDLWVEGKADEVRLVNGRLTFEDTSKRLAREAGLTVEEDTDANAPFPSAVVIYRPPGSRRYSHYSRIEGRDQNKHPKKARGKPEVPLVSGGDVVGSPAVQPLLHFAPVVAAAGAAALAWAVHRPDPRDFTYAPLPARLGGGHYHRHGAAGSGSGGLP